MAFYGGPIDIPIVPLGRFMTEKFDQLGERLALIEPSTKRELTYRQLSSKTRRFARGLSSIGFKKGDILFMFSPNVLEYPIVYFAVASLGGVLQATNPLYNSSELQHTLDLCKSKYLVTIPQLLPIVKGAQSRPKVIVIGQAEGCISISSLLDAKFSEAPINDSDIDPKTDVVAILFSSGTTGKPKAVQTTHHGAVAITLQMVATGNFRSDDSYVTFLPFFHIYGLGAILLGGLYTGARNALMSRFEPTEYLDNIKKYRATVLHVVPPVMVVLSVHPTISQYDLSSVTRIVCGAAPLSRDIEAKIIKLFNISHVTQGYGLTECPVSHVIPADKHKFGSVGKLLPGTECKIADIETMKPLPVNADGEVYLRGPAVMKGYLSNPGATAAMLDNEGWLRTGDVGYMDSDGFLFIVDRIKELIKYKAFQNLTAILEAMRWVDENNHEAVIFTDSMSAVKAIESGVSGTRDDLFFEILELDTNLNSKYINCDIVWVPAHVGLDGNEFVDKLAKTALDRPSIDIMYIKPLPRDFNSQLSTSLYSQWHDL